jgi:hypothetical protein
MSHRPQASLLRSVGGLDNPIWGDERSRAVRQEAAAVAQQVQFVAALIVVW